MNELKKRGNLWYDDNGKPFSGYCVRYDDETGVMIMEMELKNGVKHGMFRRYHTNGKMIFNTEYVNGVSSGISQQYFSDGRLKSVRILHDSLYIYAGWSDKGVVRIIREETADTIANGRTVVYNEEGKLQSYFVFSFGLREGDFVTFHDNGKIDITGKYLKGKSHGLWKKFYPSGKLAGYEIYDNGERVGTWKYFHENGKIKTLYSFKSNRIVLQIGWNDKGEKTDEMQREL